eukprot:2113819-Rhodomonas_salina.1
MKQEHDVERFVPKGAKLVRDARWRARRCHASSELEAAQHTAAQSLAWEQRGAPEEGPPPRG